MINLGQSFPCDPVDQLQPFPAANGYRKIKFGQLIPVKEYLFVSNPEGIKTDGFPESLKLGIVVPVCFGTRLGVSFAAPKGVSKRMGFKKASFLSFEKFFCVRWFGYLFGFLQLQAHPKIIVRLFCGLNST